MLIAGLQRMSMMDFPQQPCAVVFVPYCNMNCSYCHNEHILGKGTELMDEGYVLDFLERRKGLLTALTVSGGEPTLQPGLIPFIETAREMGYRIKLDTNGSKPEVLKALINKGLLEYVAMDIKGPEDKYDAVTRVKNDMQAIKRTIFYLRNSDIAHEFRTTFAAELTKEDILGAAELIQGAKRYYLQQYRKRKPEDPEPHLPSYVRETAEAVREKIGVCEVRGI